MPTFVWTDVLTEYTPGLIVVKAESEEKAWQLLKEKDSTAHRVVSGGGFEERTNPKILENNEIELVWGGG